jgi:hypothetical protein
MPNGLQTPQQTSSGANGEGTAHDLFALTDEQILEIEPELEQHRAAPAVISSEARNPSSPATADVGRQSKSDSSSPSASRNDRTGQSAMAAGATHESQVTEHGTRNTGHDAEPPAWLAAQMKDPWSGEEARALWNGVLQARQEAAAYRVAFATPEDARALKELYPGGVNEARAAANRSQLLDQIDLAYFGTVGKSAEETSAARAQLVTMMLREDPAAFREMVFAGLRALEEAEKGSAGATSAANLPRLAQIFATNRQDGSTGVGAMLASPATSAAPPFRAAFSSASAGASAATNSVVGARHAVPASVDTSVPEAHVASYAAFEKAANEDLERSVGAAITRTIEQALPNLQRRGDSTPAGARSSVPLQDRLTAAVRQDVEAALKGDHQLGEQIAQILSARRFDNETRAQVVRLIDDRARQLVPSAAKRVLNEWTQTTLAAHRGNATRTDAAAARREVEPALAHGPVAQGASPAAVSSGRDEKNRGASPRGTQPSHRVDYRKLSDEQILDL